MRTGGYKQCRQCFDILNSKVILLYPSPWREIVLLRGNLASTIVSQISAPQQGFQILDNRDTTATRTDILYFPTIVLRVEIVELWTAHLDPSSCDQQACLGC